MTLDAGRVAESVVMISTPRFVGVNDTVSPATLVASVKTKGTTPSSKKLRGYASVTVPRGGMRLVDVNDKVSDTLDFIEIRSDDDMAKETAPTYEKTDPQEDSADASGSDEVLTETPEPNPSEAAPMVSPESVNVATPNDGMAPDDTEITTRVRVEFSVRKDKPEDENAMRADIEEKKLAGKSMVIVLPTEHAPPGLT